MIDRDGIVSNVFESFFSYSYHITNVLKALQKDSGAKTEEAEGEQVGQEVAQ